MSDLLDLSKRATDAVLALGIMVLPMPSGVAVAAWAPGQPWHGQPEGRTGEDIDAWALLDDVAAGKAVIDLRDDLTRAGALPLLGREAWRDPGAWAQAPCFRDREPMGTWFIACGGRDLGIPEMDDPEIEGDTEAEAWVELLEAAARGKALSMSREADR